jgi:hypothetical protein
MGRSYHEELIAADAESPIAEASCERLDGRKRILKRIEHHEVVPGAVHLGEG